MNMEKLHLNSRKHIIEEKDISEWLYIPIDMDSLIIKRKVTCQNNLTILDVTNHMWMAGILKVSGCGFKMKQNDSEIEFPHGSYGIFFPPYSIVETELISAVNFELEVILSQRPLGPSFSKQPVVFKTAYTTTPVTYIDICDFLEHSEAKVNVGRTTKLTASAARIKGAIDECYDDPITLSTLAQKLRITPKLLSRCFRESYCISPSCYRKHLRILSAGIKLLQHQSKIVDVAFDCGYNDLSRFNKQFRSVVGTQPKEFKGKRGTL